RAATSAAADFDPRLFMATPFVVPSLLGLFDRDHWLAAGFSAALGGHRCACKHRCAGRLFFDHDSRLRFPTAAGSRRTESSPLSACICYWNLRGVTPMRFLTRYSRDRSPLRPRWAETITSRASCNSGTSA